MIDLCEFGVEQGKIGTERRGADRRIPLHEVEQFRGANIQRLLEESRDAMLAGLNGKCPAKSTMTGILTRLRASQYTVIVTATVPGFDRLTVESGKLGGQPCIRGYRFSAQQLLCLLAGGHTFEQIHEHFPFLEIADVHQVLGYAAAKAEA